MRNVIWFVIFGLATLDTSNCKIINPAKSKQKYKLERPLIVGDEIKAIGLWKLKQNPDWTQLQDPKFR